MEGQSFARTMAVVIGLGLGFFLFAGSILFLFWRSLQAESRADRKSVATIVLLVTLSAVLMILSAVLMRMSR